MARWPLPCKIRRRRRREARVEEADYTTERDERYNAFPEEMAKEKRFFRQVEDDEFGEGAAR